MADRRMFSKKILYAPVFSRLPAEVRYLYIEICLECDDDGFCPWVDRVLHSCGVGLGELKRLVEVGYLLDFGDVVVVTHWRVHNTLRKDRIKKAAFPQIAKQLWILEDGTYDIAKTSGSLTLFEYKQGEKQEKEEKTEPWYVNGMPKGREENRNEQNRTESKRRKEKRMEELCAAAGLTDVQRQTLEVIMLPDGLAEGLRQVGADGDVYGKLLAWWKERIGDGDL